LADCHGPVLVMVGEALGRRDTQLEQPRITVQSNKAA